MGNKALCLFICPLFAVVMQLVQVQAEMDQNGELIWRDNLNPTLVWWTPFTGVFSEYKTCGQLKCFFTADKSYLSNLHVNKTAVLFYGSDFRTENLPVFSRNSQIWSLLHEESPKNNPILCHEEVLNLFNFTSTFSRFSTEPITLQYLRDLKQLTRLDEFISTSNKNSFLQDGLAPVIYIQSDCDTPSDRDTFVRELATHIKVDSYGRCLNNKKLPSHLKNGVEGMDHPDLRSLVARYKFALAIENAACEDYITEKLWRPLTLGSVPLYWGSPTVSDWMPNTNSIIDIRKFNSPEELAQHLKSLLENDKQYEKHLEHKLDGKISNKLLKYTMDNRAWGVGNDEDKINFIENFECSVCRTLHRLNEDDSPTTADVRHYNCKAPVTVMQSLGGAGTNRTSKVKSHEYSSWLEEWHRAKLEAQKLRKLLETGSYSPPTYHQDVLDYLIEKGHFKKFPPSLREEL